MDEDENGRALWVNSLLSPARALVCSRRGFYRVRTSFNVHDLSGRRRWRRRRTDPNRRLSAPTDVFARFTYSLQGRRQGEKSAEWESETSASAMLGRSMKGNAAYIWIWRHRPSADQSLSVYDAPKGAAQPKGSCTLVPRTTFISFNGDVH